MALEHFTKNDITSYSTGKWKGHVC